MKKTYKLIGIFLARYGHHILIKPTMRCNLNCPYCIVNKTTGHRPVFDEVHYAKWLTLVNNVKPDVITISGGEPFMYNNIQYLIKWFVKDRIFVFVSTNLMKRIDLEPSKYLFLFATNHKSNQKLFEENLRWYRSQGHSVSVTEFGERTIKGSRLEEIKDEQTDKKIEIYAPDLTRYDSWVEMELAGK